MKETLQTIIYSLVLGVACAVLLTGTGIITTKRFLANKDADEKRNILIALGVPGSAEVPSEELLTMFEPGGIVREETRGALTVYVYEAGTESVMGVKFAGKGLWDKIAGLIALESDARTIRGISFYDQAETPGLGGEIGEPWFQDQFIGKSIVDAQGSPGIRIVSPAKAQNEVDAITGATLTCQKVEAMLNETIALIVNEKEGG